MIFFLRSREGEVYTKSIKKKTDWSLCEGVEKASELLCDKNSTILELGSGFGSYKLAEICQTYCVEHDERFLNIFDGINYIFAPLTDTNQLEGFDDNQWYNHVILKERLPASADLIIIDGPPESIGRSGLLNHLELFDKKANWIVDDTLRLNDQLLANYISIELSLIQYKFWNFTILAKNPISNDIINEIKLVSDKVLVPNLFLCEKVLSKLQKSTKHRMIISLN